MDLNIFDNVVPYDVRHLVYLTTLKSDFKLGWVDANEPEKFDLNIHRELTISDLEYTGVVPYFQKCTEETEWFTHKEISRIVLNLVRSDDVHYIHAHPKCQVLLYYINLEWRDGWHGETLFYDPYDNDKISFASLYKPGRIILFDGSIPHAIRPQSIKGPKFRFSLSLFFQ